MPIIATAIAIVGAIPAAIKAAEEVSDWAERSCIIEIDNMSADYWDLGAQGSSSGSLQQPLPARIDPFDNVLITAVSDDFAQGAVGNLGFRGRDVVLLMDYANPFVGENDLDASFVGARGGEFQVSASAGPGNKHAKFQCVVGQPHQDNWRYCPKCHGLFAAGDLPNSHCPAGGPHDPVGWEYVLLHDVPEGPNLQANWRYCPKCHGLFAGGDTANSRCPAGGPHDPVGWSYNVPHDIPEGPRLQANWRYCPKCHGLFAGGDAANSRCPAGGPHDPGGWMYNVVHKAG